MTKRLIKAENYSVNEIITEFDISKLLVSRNSLYGAYINISSNKKSKTNEPLGVWINDDNEFMLVDGYHRLVELLFKKIEKSDIKIWGIGYTNYWADIVDPFEINFNLKFNGLEDLADEEVLIDDYENLLSR